MVNTELEDFLRLHFDARKKEAPVAAHSLFNSMEYSLFSGGKRFRPQIAFAVGKTLGLSVADVMPFAAAVEMIHTYSLIHDDLPCMDNDDERRGKPTNHKVYGEAIALLAGDGLLTEAFFVLNKYYGKKAEVASALTFQLSSAAGATGMIAGQVLDIAALSGRKMTADDLRVVHNLKTGVLIQVAAFGPALISQTTEEKKTAIFNYGEHLGLAFQLADDLLDYVPDKPEKSGFPALLGVDKTKAMLQAATEKGLAALAIFGDEAKDLRKLLSINSERNA